MRHLFGDTSATEAEIEFARSLDLRGFDGEFRFLKLALGLVTNDGQVPTEIELIHRKRLFAMLDQALPLVRAIERLILIMRSLPKVGPHETEYH